MSARIHPLTDGTAGRVHAYLLEEDDGLTLIDALSGTEAATIVSAIAALGRRIDELKRILLTHAHRSHVCGAEHVRRLSGARIHAHRFEASVMAGERPSAPTGFWPRRPYRVYHLQAGLTLGHYVERAWKRLPAFANPPFEVDVEIGHGDALGGLQVVHTPGHTDGSLSFYWPSERALFTGDVLVTWPRLEAGWRGLTTDPARNRRSLADLGGVGDVEWIGTGHGPPITHDAADAVRRLLIGQSREE